MKKTLAIIALCAVGLATPALAAGAGDGSNASSSGATHGAFADENGNFGYIGKDYQGAPNLHGGVRGQEPGATGYNNSHVTTPPTTTGGSNPPGQQ